MQTQSLVCIDPSRKLSTACFVKISPSPNFLIIQYTILFYLILRLIRTNSSVGRATVSEIVGDIKTSGFESDLGLLKNLKIILRAQNKTMHKIEVGWGGLRGMFL